MTDFDTASEDFQDYLQAHIQMAMEDIECSVSHLAALLDQLLAVEAYLLAMDPEDSNDDAYVTHQQQASVVEALQWLANAFVDPAELAFA